MKDINPDPITFADFPLMIMSLFAAYDSSQSSSICFLFSRVCARECVCVCVTVK